MRLLNSVPGDTVSTKCTKPPIPPVKRPTSRNAGEVPSTTSLQATGGCGCQQILDACAAAGAPYGNGHYKFGCSNSVLEAWATGSGNSGVAHPDGFRCE